MLLLAGCGTPDAPWQPLPEVVDCDAAQTACVVRDGALAVRLRLGPGVKGMQPFPIRLEVPDAASVTVRFEMPGMDMGENRYRLQQTAPGRWEGEAVLPICLSGRSDWVAQVDIRFRDGARRRARFPFRMGS